MCVEYSTVPLIFSVDQTAEALDRFPPDTTDAKRLDGQAPANYKLRFVADVAQR